jgi:hypothetical protein
MFCSSCGVNLPENSTFCNGCGRKLGQEGRIFANRAFQIVGALVILAAIVYVLQMNSGDSSAPRGSSPSLLRPFSKPLLTGSVAVPPLRVQYWKFEVSPTMTNAHVTGTFHAAGGFGNDIEAIVAEWSECENWINGHHGEALYASGKVTNGAVDVPISGAGTYCLAFSNKISLLTGKTISGDIALQYLLP